MLSIPLLRYNYIDYQLKNNLMLDNNIYNICRQLTEENTSLWRIKDVYLKDAGGNKELETFWNKMKADKEAHVKELLDLLKKYS